MVVVVIKDRIMVLIECTNIKTFGILYLFHNTCICYSVVKHSTRVENVLAYFISIWLIFALNWTIHATGWWQFGQHDMMCVAYFKSYLAMQCTACNALQCTIWKVSLLCNALGLACNSNFKAAATPPKPPSKQRTAADIASGDPTIVISFDVFLKVYKSLQKFINVYKCL